MKKKDKKEITLYIENQIVNSFSVCRYLKKKL